MSSNQMKAVNFQVILQNILHFVKSKSAYSAPGPCDGFVLKMHYRLSFSFVLGAFLTVWYCWYYDKIIHCISHFNGDRQIREDYQNVCLSYPFVEDKKERRYLLFYRWIHWTMLLLAALFYIPRKVSKNWENAKAKRIFDDLDQIRTRYDQSEQEAVNKAMYYMAINVRTHNTLYYKYLVVNAFALLIDCFILKFVDFILHNRFLLYVPNSYPFGRNAGDFSDYISQTFPPFANCELSDNHKIIPGRTEVIGCHLTLMELYEKIFFLLWLLLAILIITTLSYLVYLLIMFFPTTWGHFLSTSKPQNCIDPVTKLKNKLSNNLKVGDVYFLYRLKSHMSNARFYELLLRLTDPKVIKQRPCHPKDNNKIGQGPQLLKHRLSSGIVDSTGNHAYYRTLNIEQKEEYNELLKEKGLNDTSILIE